MGLKAEAETVSDRASRIVNIIARSQLLQQQTSVLLDENPDLTIALTPQTKQDWIDRIKGLQGEIKTIVAGW